jgi:autotransporter passenger strand-loop-strand repeat protein
VASGSFVAEGMLDGSEYNGAQEVNAGGITSDTTVVAGGLETVLAGGAAVSTTVSAGGAAAA